MKNGLISTRRKFLKSASIWLMFCGFNANYLTAKTTSKNQSGFKVLDENDVFNIGNMGEEMIQKAFELGYQFEEKYKGCARCTVASLQDAIDFIPVDEELFRTASCLDGGATSTKLANCGSFTGSGMVIGWLCGTGRFGNNQLSHKLINKVHECFANEYGGIICKDVRERANRKCPEVVANAAKWTAKILLKQFTNYE